MILNSLMGMKVYTSPLAYKAEPAVFSWIDKIIAWNPCNRELLPKPRRVPVTYMFNGNMVVAPEVLADLRNIT